MNISKMSKRGFYYALGKIANPLLKRLESGSLKRSTGKLRYPPIFIIGVPRTGTTLFYQLMLRRFNLAYVPNISGIFYEAPILVAELGKWLLAEHETSFDSSYGRTKGLMAPHEAGKIWNRWYPTEQREGFNYSAENTVDESEKDLMYQTVKGFEDIFDAPFLNKNVMHGVRIRSLVDIFPHALFIQMKRDRLRVAVSILHARTKNEENVSKWWSVMPKEIEHLRDLPYLDQVAGQVYYVEKNISRDIERVGDWRLKEIHYESLCKSPRKEIRKVRLFAEQNGLQLDTRAEIPDRFQLSRSKKNVSLREKRLLKEKLDRLYES